MDQRYDEVAGALDAPMRAALEQLQQPALGQPGRPKHSIMLTPFFTWAGVTGMVNPLGLESIVHPDLLPYERPFVLAHEWAHLAGQADEAQASAVGWLACMRGTPQLAYSASLYLIMEAASALPSDARQTVMKQLDAGVRSDIDDILRRLQKGEPRRPADGITRLRRISAREPRRRRHRQLSARVVVDSLGAASGRAHEVRGARTRSAHDAAGGAERRQALIVCVQ